MTSLRALAPCLITMTVTVTVTVMLVAMPNAKNDTNRKKKK